MMADYIEPIYYRPQLHHAQRFHDIMRPSSSLGSRLPGPSSPRRPRTTSMYTQARPEEPWDRRAHTHAWVMEQGMGMGRRSEEPREWMRKQQDYERYREGRPSGVFGNIANSRRFVDESTYGTDFDDGRGDIMQETWRASLQRHRERERLMQEEARRMAAARLEAERHRVHERRRAEEARLRAEMDMERAKRDETERQAWRVYEEGWTALSSATDSSEQLTFRDIPWPMIYPPQAVEDITPGQIVMFLLSPLHACGLSRKERIKKALLKWHPDRFSRILAHIREEDKAMVEEGAGTVTRCLNKLLEREG